MAETETLGKRPRAAQRLLCNKHRPEQIFNFTVRKEGPREAFGLNPTDEAERCWALHHTARGLVEVAWAHTRNAE